MIELRTLGRIDLVSIGAVGRERVDGLLTQYKPTALLIYLLLKRPHGFQRRDELVAMLWPELDHRRSRAALSQTLYVLRRHLGDDVVESRGMEEIRIAPGTIRCDALEFRHALEQDQPEDALLLYAGELLPAFFVSEAIGFERWLDAERASLASLASSAAWGLADSYEKAGNRVAARHWGRRAAALAPYDELSTRRLMEFLARLGDRSGALRAFEQFRERSGSELQIEPSSATVALAEKIRASVESAPGQPESALRTDADLPAASVSAAVPTSSTSPTGADETRTPSRPRGRRELALSVALVALAMTAVYLVARTAGVRLPGDATASSHDRSIVVMPIRPRGEADTSRAELYGLRLVDALALAGFHVASPGPAAVLPDSVLEVYRSGAGAKWTVEGDLHSEVGSPPELSIRIIDELRDRVVWAFVFREGGRSTGDFVLHVARTTAVQLARQIGIDPETARVPRFTADAVADSLWSEAFFLSQTNYTWPGAQRAADLFRQAIERDSTFVPAYVGLAAELNASARIFWRPPPHSVRAEIEALLERAMALDPAYGPLHAELGWHAYTFDWDWEQAERHYREAISLQPNFGRVHAMYAFLLIATGRLEEGLAESRRGTELAANPLTVTTYCFHLYLVGRYEEAVEACDRVLTEMDPTYPVAIGVRTGASLRAMSPPERAETIRAHPEFTQATDMPTGEWGGATLAAMAGDTARAIEIIETEKRNPRVRPFRVANDYAWAGQLDSAFAWLDRAIESRDPYLPEIMVRPIMEPYRGDPRYEAVLERLNLR